jgi:hypothetical protein
VKTERRSSIMIALATILVLSLAIVALLSPLLKTLSLPSVALGGGSSFPKSGELVANVTLLSSGGGGTLGGVIFLINSTAGSFSSSYSTNASGMFTALLPSGHYFIRSSDKRFLAQASFSIWPGRVTLFFVRVNETDIYPTFYDAVDSDSSGFLDSTETLFATFPSTDSPFNASSGVILDYINGPFIIVFSDGFSVQEVTFGLGVETANATVVSSEVRGGSLYAAFRPLSAVPLQGFSLLWVSSYSVFDNVTYNGG